MCKRLLSFLFIFSFLLCKVLGASSPLLEADGKPTQPLIEIAKIYDISGEDQFDSILAFAQTHFLQNSKERWEFSDVTSDKTEELFTAFRSLGCIDEIHPKQQTYTYALVLGSTENNMKDRISYLVQEWEKGVRFSEVVLLSGERPLDPKIEPASASFETESDLIAHLWLALTTEDLHSLPVTVIRSPMKYSSSLLKRPNTQDTLIDWLKLSPMEGSCLAVSSQPFVYYQESVLQTYLPQGFTLDTIGPKSSKAFSLSLYLDNLAKWLFQEHMRKLKE